MHSAMNSLWSILVLAHVVTAQPPFEAPEPFEYLKDVCMDCGPPAPLSPDPLVQAQWSDSTNLTELQIYRVTQPSAIHTEPGNCSPNLMQWWNGGTNTLEITQPCNMTIDWGVERAGWFEFIANSSLVHAGISEFNTPYPGKTKKAVPYGKQTYRLESNKELYEGVRYTFLTFFEPTAVYNLSVVAKIKPVPYTGAYSSSNDDLTKFWYTGAYGVRLNMEADQFNSILIERGDRVAIQGDAHPSLATALVGFGSTPMFEFIQLELWRLNSGHVHGHNVVDQGIMAYPLYWCLSVLDWYWASGNHTGFQELVPDVRSILDIRINTFLDYSQDITWMGWDDRLGNGWCFHGRNDTCPIEGHWTLAGLVTRVCKDLARSLEAVGDAELAKEYKETHQKLIRQYRLKVPTDKAGVHAAANEINADIVAAKDIPARIQSKLNNVGTLCSWSPFNQYWILQALSHDVERGLASVELCWGPMIKLNKGCFWELSGPNWHDFLKEGDMAPTMASLCHPWASGVTAWLAHVHGGIRPLQPGYREAIVAPYVSTNYPNVSATVPTEHGAISVNAILDQNKFLRVEVDSPVPTYVGLRNAVAGACVLKRESILVDRKTESTELRLFGAHDIEGSDLDAHLQNLAFIKLPSGGRHSLLVSYGCNQGEVAKGPTEMPSPFPPATYSAKVSFDRKSRGDGLKKYGSDGYILLGYNEDQSDLESLPTYVQGVKIRNHGYGGWDGVERGHVGTSNDDPTYLPNPVNGSAPRALGKIDFGEPGYWDPGVLVDVELKARNALESVLVDIRTEEQSFQLSIYCAGQGKNAVRIMDLENLDPIAATILVDKYEEGIWYKISYTKSIRLRIMSMYGIQVSAIAFASPTVETAQQ